MSFDIQDHLPQFVLAFDVEVFLDHVFIARRSENGELEVLSSAACHAALEEAVERGDLRVHSRPLLPELKDVVNSEDFTKYFGRRELLKWALEKGFIPSVKWERILRPQAPAWSKWLAKDAWTVGEAVGLVFGRDPINSTLDEDIMQRGGDRKFGEDRFVTDEEALSRLVLEAIETDVLQAYSVRGMLVVRPTDFLRWLEGKEFVVPEPLNPLLESEEARANTESPDGTPANDGTDLQSSDQQAQDVDAGSDVPDSEDKKKSANSEANTPMEASVEEGWLTVSDAARRYVAELDATIMINSAKGMLSKACDRGELKHLGKGRDRRIDPDALNTKILEARNKALDKDAVRK